MSACPSHRSRISLPTSRTSVGYSPPTRFGRRDQPAVDNLLALQHHHHEKSAFGTLRRRHGVSPPRAAPPEATDGEAGVKDERQARVERPFVATTAPRVSGDGRGADGRMSHRNPISAAAEGANLSRRLAAREAIPTRRAAAFPSLVCRRRSVSAVRLPLPRRLASVIQPRFFQVEPLAPHLGHGRLLLFCQEPGETAAALQGLAAFK